MRAAEAHQQELEQMEYEETTAHLIDEYGHEIKVNIWSDEDSVFVNLVNWPMSFTVTLQKQQAEKVHELLTNALRRAE
jgi:hypothetical protein